MSVGLRLSSGVTSSVTPAASLRVVAAVDVEQLAPRQAALERGGQGGEIEVGRVVAKAVVEVFGENGGVAARERNGVADIGQQQDARRPLAMGDDRLDLQVPGGAAKVSIDAERAHQVAMIAGDEPGRLVTKDRSVKMEGEGAGVGARRDAGARRSGRDGQLQVRAVGEQTLDIEHVRSGLVLGVGGGRRERIDQIHGPKDQSATPCQGLAADPDNPMRISISDRQAVETLAGENVAVVGDSLGKVEPGGRRRARTAASEPGYPYRRSILDIG